MTVHKCKVGNYRPNVILSRKKRDSRMHILSIVAYKHFPQDNPTVLYLPEAPAAFLKNIIHSGTGFVEVKAYVDKYCEPYSIKIVSGSNQKFIAEKPDHVDRMLVPVKDILDIQQTHIDLDNYGARSNWKKNASERR